jgi:hypothetical protein
VISDVAGEGASRAQIAMSSSKGPATLTPSEEAVLDVFRAYRIAFGEMLCFTGPQLDKHRASLRQLAEKELLVAERFAGGYSLTQSGVAAMKERKRTAAAAPSARK